MVANNFIEVYTLLFAWQVYEGIWDILAGSGLALIPFVAAILSSAKEGYERGDSKLAIAKMEISVLSMLLVLIFCVIPYGGGFTSSLSTVTYTLDSPDCAVRAMPSVSKTGTGDALDPNYDSTFSDMSTTVVRRSILWSLMQQVSSAITHATIRSMGCVNNYSFMLARISSVKITDPVLRSRIKDFHGTCYKKAIERFNINPIVIPPGTSETNNIDWIGSGILLQNLNEYYRHPDAYMEYMDGYGFTRSNRPTDLSMETGAHPYCYEVWSGENFGGGNAEGLRDLILEDIPVDDAGDILGDWIAWGSEVMSVGVLSTAEQEDLIIKMILESDNYDSMNNLILANQLEEQSALGMVADVATGALTFFASINELFKAEVMKNMIKVAGPIVIALIQMLIIFTSPIVMVLNQYSLQAFTSLVLTYFTLEFVNAIWSAAFWFEQRILDLYISQSGFGEILTNGFIVSLVSITALFLLPVVWIGIMGRAGASMIRGIGSGGLNSAGSSASINSGSMAMKGMKAMKK